jgi:hypothetical protein
MTDTASPALPPEIQAKLDAIRADIAAEEALAAQAVQAEEARLAKLDAAKQVCFDLCGPISEAVSTSTDPRARQALIDLETQTHESHREALENAYLESNGQRRGEGNQAVPGEITQLETHVAVMGDSSGEVTTQ